MRGFFARAALSMLVMACVLVTLVAHAHQAGISRGRYDLRSAALSAHVVFANAELANAIPGLDTDRNGAVSADEVRGGSAVLTREVVDRVRVTADGESCPVTFASATLTEQDGVDVELAAACPSRPKKLVLHCGFLDVMPSAHRHFASVTTVEGAEPFETVAVPGNMDVEVDVASTADSGSFKTLLLLGVEHILTGYDHLVFLFGLILTGGRPRSLIAALSAFTLAHSISLAIAVLGVWVPRPILVEPAIALSIAYVGVENLWRGKRLTPAIAGAPEKAPDAPDPARGRWRITFPFGLIHGFGFAGALVEIGLPRARIPGALLGFNLGVELGQLAILAAVLPLLMLARRSAFVRGRLTLVANVAIVVAGVVWFVSRITSG